MGGQCSHSSMYWIQLLKAATSAMIRESELGSSHRAAQHAPPHLAKDYLLPRPGPWRRQGTRTDAQAPRRHHARTCAERPALRRDGTRAPAPEPPRTCAAGPRDGHGRAHTLTGLSCRCSAAINTSRVGLYQDSTIIPYTCIPPAWLIKC